MITTFWNARALKEKIGIVLLAIVFSVLVFYFGKYSYYKYKYYKQIEIRYNALKEDIKQIKEREKTLVKMLKHKTKIITSESEKIDKKLKADEKIIDNDSITDSDIAKFLARY